MSTETYTNTELEEYRELQQLAYTAVEAVREKLHEGITEKEAAGMIDQELLGAGVHSFFHHGFAWFGDRTSFHGFKRPLSFFGEGILPHFGFEFQPSKRKLEKGMAVILDVAPVRNGKSCDIGYSFCYGGEDPEMNKATQALKEYREMILEMVLAENTLAEIYKATDQLIKDSGYKNCHAIYPQGVLGHKVGNINYNWTPPLRFMGFNLRTFAYLGSEIISALFHKNDHSPLWHENSHFRADQGLWAVEPHIGNKRFGVKWEEILVVNNTTAYWLDDNLPHVNNWRKLEIQDHITQAAEGRAAPKARSAAAPSPPLQFPRQGHEGAAKPLPKGRGRQAEPGMARSRLRREAPIPEVLPVHLSLTCNTQYIF